MIICGGEKPTANEAWDSFLFHANKAFEGNSAKFKYWRRIPEMRCDKRFDTIETVYQASARLFLSPTKIEGVPEAEIAKGLKQPGYFRDLESIIPQLRKES